MTTYLTQYLNKHRQRKVQVQRPHSLNAGEHEAQNETIMGSSDHNEQKTSTLLSS